MNANLTSLNDFPLSQPYNQPPWNYQGTENVPSIPNSTVIDWVLIELRDAADAPSATPETMIARQAAFLLSNGSVVGINGLDILTFDNSVNNSLFVVVWHRNHLGIMSAVPLTLSGGIYSYDFTTSASKAYGNTQVDLGGDKFGMYSGDYNGDNQIDTSDKAGWTNEAGNAGYFTGDFNLDSQVDNMDKNDNWLLNNSQAGSVPN